MHLAQRGNLWFYAFIGTLHFGDFVVKKAVNNSIPYWGWYACCFVSAITKSFFV
jgi:hypothetical protein